MNIGVGIMANNSPLWSLDKHTIITSKTPFKLLRPLYYTISTMPQILDKQESKEKVSSKPILLSSEPTIGAIIIRIGLWGCL